MGKYGRGCSAPEGCEGRHYSRGLCSMHYRRQYRRGTTEDTRADAARRILLALPLDREACWPWKGWLHGDGYGLLSDVGRRTLTHRVSYELFVGPVPDGLQLDHLCRNRACFNPWHLEAVTSRVNLLRGETLAAANAAKTHCPAGHPYDDFNTRWHRGHRACRACQQARRGAA